MNDPDVTPRPRRRSPYLAAAIAAPFAVLAGIGWFVAFSGQTAAPHPAAVHLSGRLSVPDSDANVNAACDPPADYSDIHRGAQVTVTDEAGKVVALGTLGAGLGRVEDKGTLTIGWCGYRFEIADVAARPYYGVEVAHRGVVRFTRAQAEHGDIDVSLYPR